jgi:NAD-dependent deacetylase
MSDQIKPRLVALTGAGISAESGLKTFRDSDGLWEGYNVYDVATPEAWRRNPALVQEFYNERRKCVLAAAPSDAHKMLASLESRYNVTVITQNIDDLHERAGSSDIVHLHGEIRKSRSSLNPELVYDIDGWELKMGEKCELGSQLRPHVVWFGEAVPMIEAAARLVSMADIFLVIGTSMQVYPAAGLINYFDETKPLYVIDPKLVAIAGWSNIRYLQATASEGMRQLLRELGES